MPEAPEPLGVPLEYRLTLKWFSVIPTASVIPIAPKFILGGLIAPKTDLSLKNKFMLNKRKQRMTKVIKKVRYSMN